MLEDFFKDAVRARNETMWPELARKYKIPIRRGDVVVKTNGARLGAHASEPLLKRELTADDIFGRR
jgi:hypothetical protein